MRSVVVVAAAVVAGEVSVAARALGGPRLQAPMRVTRRRDRNLLRGYSYNLLYQLVQRGGLPDSNDKVDESYNFFRLHLSIVVREHPSGQMHIPKDQFLYHQDSAWDWSDTTPK